MKDISIPIYRAKKIDSDEWVEGLLRITKEVQSSFNKSKEWIDEYHVKVYSINIVDGNECILTPTQDNAFEIDPTTLAIHFPDMLDSEGNKIFASLSEDGKGGDILQGFNDSDYYFRVFYTNFMCMMTRVDVYLPTALDTRLKVTGIQK